MKTEVDLMKAVRGHDSVVQLHETYEDKWNFYMVMEWCKGGELMDRILQQKHFSERVAADYFRKMCEGVQHCHNRLVVHRDLKPENFLFVDETVDSALKLTDFGLSCFIEKPDSIITEACGSAYYIAPEVFDNAYTKACDVWGLGVVLFLFLSGTVPFGADAEEEAEVYQSIQSDPLVLEGHVWDSVSAAARELVEGMLDKDPTKRYTIEQALAHPWVKGDAAPDAKMDKMVLQSMKGFTARNKFKREALRMIASTLGAADVANLRKVFHEMDSDHTGSLSFSELADAVARLGMEDCDVRELMDSIDIDGDGTINYEEFLVATAERQLVNNQNNIWWAFCEYDADGNGKISEEELQKVMKHESPETVRKYIDEYDIDKDGMIDYEEFMRMVLPKDLKFKISRY